MKILQKNNFVFLLSLFFYTASGADSVFVSFRQILESVKAFHPIVSKIALTRPDFRYRVMLARGQFDPIVTSDFEEKNFNQKNYFTKWYHALKIPTFTGINFHSGIENNHGELLNNEEFTNDGTLLSIGASIPAGRSFWFNERQLILRQAKILEKASVHLQNQYLNQFLTQLGKDYAQWLFAFRKLHAYSFAYSLAKDRYMFMLQRIEWGDEAPIDSTEMSIQIQFLSARLSETLAEYIQKKAKINTYLWDKNQKPLELSENMFPTTDFSTVLSFHDSIYPKDATELVLKNPFILFRQSELKTMELATLFARFQLLPDVYLGYSALNKFSSPMPSWKWMENSKWNGHLYFPLFLRKERAKIQMAKIKQQQKALELQFKIREAEVKIKAMREIYQQLSKQNNILQLALKNSIKLRDAEKTKFNNGESSVFLINVRENNLLDMQVRCFSNELSLQSYYFDFLELCGVLYMLF